jgi:hypothetical protein
MKIIFGNVKITSKVSLPKNYPQTKLSKKVLEVAAMTFYTGEQLKDTFICTDTDGDTYMSDIVKFLFDGVHDDTDTILLDSFRAYGSRYNCATASETKWLRGIARKALCRTLAIIRQVYPESKDWLLYLHAMGGTPTGDQDDLVKLYQSLGLRLISRASQMDILAAPLADVCMRRNVVARNTAARLIQGTWRRTRTNNAPLSKRTRLR